MWTWVKECWERVFLFAISLVFLALCLRFFLKAEVAGATAAFVMFFLCLIYANVSRFKRFKGLGFEAELWEDKQKEAADLIERLKNIVQVYTREIVMMKVMSGRWGGGSIWPDRWALYEELVGQHDTLGQKIDFLPLKEKVYRVMVFDAVASAFSPVQRALSKGREEARKVMDAEFGSPITDIEGYNKRAKDLSALHAELKDMFKVSETKNVARYAIDFAENFCRIANEKFGISVQLPQDEMERLRKIDALFEVGDFKVEPELIQWADHER
jgi:hypothetical protein